MMNRYAFPLALICVSLTAQAQTVLSPAEYQNLKAHELLPSGPIIISGDPGTGLPVSTSVLERGGGGACDCWIAPDTTYQMAMLPNDDMSSTAITLPFTFSLFSEPYAEVYINNNGNVSFGTPYGTFTATGFPSDGFVMVAPFWADVDTRGEDGSGLNGGEVVYKVTDHALYVNWVDVGYFSMQTDLHNAFQLIITDGTDPVIPGGNNVSFCYQDMQWTTGSASGGLGGFDGTPATAGVNRGNSGDHAQVGRFSLNDDSYAGPYVESSGVDWLDNTHFYLNTTGTGVPPIFGSTFDCDTVIVQMPLGPEDRDGELYHLIVLPGAPDQMVSCVSSAPTLPNFENVNEGLSSKLELEFQINSDEAEVGLHYITFTATNDDAEPLSSTYVLQVEKTGTGSTDIAANAVLEGIALAPNPALESSVLAWPADVTVRNVVVLGLDGKQVATFSLTAREQRLVLLLDGLATGTYLVRALTDSGVRTERLVKVPR
ncbi:MAG: T9SS type A sorting domain-containing protein [Flavobacteriales bacterium]|nr:T9SS type A sorting domain-containing protein [Flavobacteriales bacterium]